jgi:hypothetical protein
MLPEITLNDSSLKLLLGIVGTLFAISVVRLFLLFRDNRRMRRDIAVMEKQSSTLHNDLLAIKHDSRSWREKMDRQFDATRADFKTRLEQLERHQDKLLGSLGEKIQEKSGCAEQSCQCAAAAADEVRAAPVPSEAAVPTLPAIETLKAQGLGAEVFALQEQLNASRQQCAALQRSLALSRRRPAPQSHRGVARSKRG